MVLRNYYVVFVSCLCHMKLILIGLFAYMHWYVVFILLFSHLYIFCSKHSTLHTAWSCVMTETELIGNHHARLVLELDNQVESIAKTFRYAALIFLPVDFIYF